MSDEASGAEPSPPDKKKSRFSFGSKKDPGAKTAPTKTSPLMQRNVMAAVATALFAVVGVLLLVSYIQGAEDDAAAERALKPVVVATGPIPSGTLLSEILDGESSRISIQELPDDAIASGAFDSLDKLAAYEDEQAIGDLMLNADLATGEQLLTSRISPIALFSSRVAKVAVPADHHQTTIQLSRERAVGGLIRPGDRVSVVATFASNPDTEKPTTAMILASIEVVSVLVEEDVIGRNVSSETADDPFLAPQGKYLVTVAVTSDELTKLTYAQENARIVLAAASDSPPTGDTYPQDLGTVLNSPAFVADAPSSLAFNEGSLNDALPVPGSTLEGGAAAADEPNAGAGSNGDGE